MEILAPIGNRESLDAALRLKPDAVYFGLKNFNARLRTYNFSIEQAGTVINMCRKRGIRSYITLNTLLKNNEFDDITKLLSTIETITPDGIIVQDLGLAHIISRYYPALDIFASTQTTNLNSKKLRFLEKQSFKRVILERQLTIEEIKKIKEASGIDIELFILGAVCYSFSGQCLFSSYIGSKSANRGLCTQPCRRLYESRGKRDYIFSIKDLDWTEYLGELKSIGISGIKIEGRMKPGSYVYQAISYIQGLLQGQHISEAVISRPPARLLMDKKENLYHEPISGRYAGRVTFSKDNTIRVSASIKFQEYDIIRLVNKANDYSSSNIKILSVRHLCGITYELELNKSDIYPPDLMVYLIGRNYNLQDPMKKIKTSKISYPLPKRIKMPKPNREDLRNSHIYIIDRHEWCDILRGEKILLELRNYDTDTVKNIKPFGIKLPSCLLEDDIQKAEKLMTILISEGIRNIMVSDESQLEIITGKNAFNIYQDPHMKNLNSFSNHIYLKSGIKYTSFFLEGDIPSLITMPRSIFIAIYSVPVLFVSRIPPLGFYPGFLFRDTKDLKFYKVIEKGDIYYTIPENPLNLMPIKTKLENYGFTNFIYDLRFIKPDRKKLQNIIRKQERQDTSLFNIKRGLR